MDLFFNLGLCLDAKKPEIFLISCAALANLASIDDLCLDYFGNFDTLMVLADSCSKGSAPSIFAKEQVLKPYCTCKWLWLWLSCYPVWVDICHNRVRL